MLRTVTNIIMTCLLLISTTGFAVSKHYCGSDLVSIELKTEAEPCCDDGMCCHTESQFMQLESDFLAATANFNLENLYSSDILLTTSEIEISFPETNFKTSFNYSGPPPYCTGTNLALRQVYRL